MIRVALPLALIVATFSVSNGLQAENSGTALPFDVRYLCVVSIEGSADGARSEGEFMSATHARSNSFPLLGETGRTERPKTEAEFISSDGSAAELNRMIPWADRLTARAEFTFTRRTARKLVTRRPYTSTGAKCLNLNVEASLSGLGDPLQLYAADCVGEDGHGRPSLARSASAYEASVLLGHRESTLRLRVRCEKDRGYRFSFNF